MKADWTKIKTEYITGDMTYSALAKKRKVALGGLNEVARQEGWVAARAAYRKKVEVMLIDKAADAESTKLSKLYSAADSVMAIVESVAKVPENFVDEDKGKADLSAVRNMVNIIDKATDTMRKLYGFRSVDQQDNREIELERIRAEKCRQIAEEDDGRNDIGVIELPSRLEMVDNA